jgi:hypothetical protein
VPDPNSLPETIAALGALPGRDRRAILAALEPEERARAAALLGARGAPTPPVRPEPALALSPWLAERLTAADGRVTPATRRILVEASEAAGRGDGAAAPAPRGRSLLGALGALLSRRTGAP